MPNVLLVLLKEQDISGVKSLAGSIVQMDASRAPDLVNAGLAKYKSEFQPEDLPQPETQTETTSDKKKKKVDSSDVEV